MARARASKAVLAFLIGLAFTLLAWGGGLGVDQALFASVANVIRRGGTLDLDLWDKKQPGVYWLYAAAQAAFGEGWPGDPSGAQPLDGRGAGPVAETGDRAAGRLSSGRKW